MNKGGGLRFKQLIIQKGAYDCNSTSLLSRWHDTEICENLAHQHGA